MPIAREICEKHAMSASTENDKGKDALPVQSVAGQVLQTFIDALAAEAGYEDIAARLKSEIIDKRSMSEASLRGAIFGGDGN